ncbi:uncharacterized protein LOC143018338 [Oratosquilla oratoria]|uniref:uncharacterized protein LOC143018338 n=1 Tax=Oratosquilla oratoria TaxID=337810 RepID=UPI003F775648
MEVFKDTNNSTYVGKPKEFRTLASWLKNPQKVKLLNEDGTDVKGYEWPLQNLGTMEQFHTRDRRAFTYTYPKHDNIWFKAPVHEENAFNYLPQFGTRLRWDQVNTWKQQYPQDNFGQLPIYMRMTPVQAHNGSIIRFKATMQCDKFITLNPHSASDAYMRRQVVYPVVPATHICVGNFKNS